MTDYYGIKQMPPQDRPYERCRNQGPEVLTDTELLAVILRTGSRDVDVMELASSLLSEQYAYDGIASLLDRTYEEYIQIPGIGNVKAVQLMCLGEFCKRIWRHRSSNQPVILRDAASGAQYFREEMRFLEREQLRVAFLDGRCRLIRDKVLTTGTYNTSLVSVRDILIEALRHRATAILVLHNHPGGDAYPSEEDIRVTEKIRQGCQAIGLTLFDHIIICVNGYYSFKERNMLNG